LFFLLKITVNQVPVDEEKLVIWRYHAPILKKNFFY
jgi:hypothetical protein